MFITRSRHHLGIGLITCGGVCGGGDLLMFTRGITSRLPSSYLVLSWFYYLLDVALFEYRTFCDVSPFVNQPHQSESIDRASTRPSPVISMNHTTNIDPKDDPRITVVLVIEPSSFNKDVSPIGRCVRTA